MKLLKIIVFTIMVLICVTFIGENYIYYLDSFTDNNYYTEVSLKNNDDFNKFVQDFQTKCRDNSVMGFAISNETKSLNESKLIVYGTSGVKSYLENKEQIEEGTHSSVISGKCVVKYENFVNANENSISRCYLIGEKSNIYNCVSSLDYDCTLPKKSNNIDSSILQILGMWILVIGVSAIFSVYDLLNNKKEYLLRVFFGENAKAIVIKNIVIDSFLYLLIYSTIRLILGFLYKSDFYCFISDCSILFIVLINILTYIFLFKTDVRKGLSEYKASSNLLIMNYVFKTISIVLVFLIVSGNLVIIRNGINQFKQYKDFSQYRDYSYIELSDDPIVNTSKALQNEVSVKDRLNYNFYKQNYSSNDGVGIWGFDLNDRNVLGMLENEDNDYIIANKNAKKYLQSKIKDIDICKFDKDVIYLLPSKFKGEKNKIDKIKSMFYFLDDTLKTASNSTVYYKESDGITVVNGEDDEMPSYYLYNVPIVLINTSACLNSESFNQPLKWSTYNRATMYHFNQKELNTLKAKAKSNHIELRVTNVFDYYKYRWQSIEKSMYISVVMAIMILIMEVALMKSLLMLEYSANCKELLLRKILGSNLFKRNLRIILIANLSSAIGFLISLIIFLLIEPGQLPYMIIIGLLLTVFENILIYYYIHKMEKVSINKVFKGGRL